MACACVPHLERIFFSNKCAGLKTIKRENSNLWVKVKVPYLVPLGFLIQEDKLLHMGRGILKTSVFQPAFLLVQSAPCPKGECSVTSIQTAV